MMTDETFFDMLERAHIPAISAGPEPTSLYIGESPTSVHHLRLLVGVVAEECAKIAEKQAVEQDYAFAHKITDPPGAGVAMSAAAAIRAKFGAQHAGMTLLGVDAARIEGGVRPGDEVRVEHSGAQVRAWVNGQERRVLSTLPPINSAAPGSVTWGNAVENPKSD